MDGKTKAIVAHLFWIGWIIALVLNSNDKDEFASFYIRQNLGLMLAGTILTLIPVIGIFIAIVVLVFWIMSLIASIQGEKKETPYVGAYFQDWFKML